MSEYSDVNQEPFFCAITPIFDGAIESVKLLIQGLQAQTLDDFIHVMISAGPSPQCQKLISGLNDKRFIYDETPTADLSNPRKILSNLGKRRNMGFLKYNAARYGCFDADLKIIASNYLEHLKKHHVDAHILITKTLNRTAKGQGRLPKFPLTAGRIDLANFTFSRAIAKLYRYPTDVDGHHGTANDWRFYAAFPDDAKKFLSMTSAIVGGNNTYQRMSELL